MYIRLKPFFLYFRDKNGLTMKWTFLVLNLLLPAEAVKDRLKISLKEEALA